jgi:hypothetical protein
MLDSLLSGPRWVDLIIAFTLVEGVAISLYFRATGRGVAPAQFGVNMVSGLCLMFALRSALAGSGAVAVAAGLLGAGLAHGLDLWRRWQR